jgi:hypothetical protein
VKVKLPLCLTKYHTTKIYPKQAKLQWLQNPSQTTGVNRNNVRCETSRIFRNKNREYLKEKCNKLEKNRTKISQTYIEA